MPHCYAKFLISLKKDEIQIDAGEFEYEIDDLYALHFECGNQIKRSISNRSDLELQEFTEFLAGYHDHIDNVVWEMRQIMEDEYVASLGNDGEKGYSENLYLETDLIRFTGIFANRHFVASNISGYKCV